MRRSIQSTLWLDFLTYIALPIVFLLGIFHIIVFVLPQMTWDLYVIITLLIEIAFLIFYGYTVYHAHKRTKRAYYLLRILVWVTAIRTSLDFANTECINKGYNFFLMFAIYFVACYIIWVHTNEIYLEKRKDLFGRLDALKNHYRCKKCKSLVLVGENCPHCEKEKIEEDAKKEEGKKGSIEEDSTENEENKLEEEVEESVSDSQEELKKEEVISSYKKDFPVEIFSDDDEEEDFFQEKSNDKED